MKKLVILNTVIFLFNSCRFNSSFTNNPADKKDAEVIANKLFELLKQKKYDSTSISSASVYFFQRQKLDEHIKNGGVFYKKERAIVVSLILSTRLMEQIN